MSDKTEQPNKEQVTLETIISGTDNLAEIEIAEVADMRGMVTNFHWNDDFLRWWKNNCNDTDLYKAKRRFTYYANKLVDKGFLLPCQRIGIGIGGESSFGVKTQTVWDRKYH